MPYTIKQKSCKNSTEKKPPIWNIHALSNILKMHEFLLGCRIRVAAKNTKIVGITSSEFTYLNTTKFVSLYDVG